MKSDHIPSTTTDSAAARKLIVLGEAGNLALLDANPDR